MDAFILAASSLSSQILPILGVVALIFLIILLANVIKLIKEITNNLKDMDKTVDLVNDSLVKIQDPLDTASKLSKTVDKAHDSGIAVLKEAAGVLADNFHVVKDYLNEKQAKDGGK